MELVPYFAKSREVMYSLKYQIASEKRIPMVFCSDIWHGGGRRGRLP